MLSARYFRRLKLDPSDLDSSPTLKKLTAIVQAHVEHIPFENLSQHGAPFPASLDLRTTAHKILDAGRGGFCYEVNSLLSEWLYTELQYPVVHRLHARVAFPDGRGYENPNQDKNAYVDTHICMMVAVDEQSDSEYYFVDVGHGEPPLHPLKFEWNTEQTTQEGMVSRFVPYEGGGVSLERWNEVRAQFEPSVWFEWNPPSPRATLDPPLPDFSEDFTMQYQDDSPFAQKIICCRITRTHKYTLVAGTRLKITTPRFGPDSVQNIRELETLEEARSVLEELFGMPLESTEGLDLGISKKADPEIHNQL